MYLITLSERKSYGEPGVNPDRRAVSNIKVPTTEIPCDSSSFFFREVTWTFIGAEGGGRSTSECAIVVVIVLMREVGLDLGKAHWRCEACHCGGCTLLNMEPKSRNIY